MGDLGQCAQPRARCESTFWVVHPGRDTGARTKACQILRQPNPGSGTREAVSDSLLQHRLLGWFAYPNGNSPLVIYVHPQTRKKQVSLSQPFDDKYAGSRRSRPSCEQILSLFQLCTFLTPSLMYEVEKTRQFATT